MYHTWLQQEGQRNYPKVIYLARGSAFHNRIVGQRDIDLEKERRRIRHGSVAFSTNLIAGHPVFITLIRDSRLVSTRIVATGIVHGIVTDNVLGRDIPGGSRRRSA